MKGTIPSDHYMINIIDIILEIWDHVVYDFLRKYVCSFPVSLFRRSATMYTSRSICIESAVGR